MIENILKILAPHHCCSCGQIGGIICDNCKNYIIDEQKTICIICHAPTINDCLCQNCHAFYQKAWIVGDRKGVLQRLIGLYKFERAKEAYKALGDLLISTLPDLPDNVVLVPVPTVASHIRERGYDHMMLIARYMSKKTGLAVNHLLVRRSNTKQRQADAKRRENQAKNAFEVVGEVDNDKIYLILDDVVTTGATIKYASRELYRAGAKHIWVAVLARQILK